MQRFFIIQNNDYIGVFKPGKCPAYSYTRKENFKDFIKSIKETYPDAKLTLNRDAENIRILQEKILYDKKMLKLKQNGYIK